MTTTLGALRAPHTLISIIGAASALGAPHAGSAAAPAALQGGALMHRLAAIGPNVEWAETLLPTAAERATSTPRLPAADRSSAPVSAAATDMATRVAANAAFAHRLADHIAALPPGSFPLVLGGDHAIAAGTWRGVGRRRGRAPGLIWIDAHLDSHTDATTHSGNIHGMPLAALLGVGHDALTGIAGPALDPARTCIIGARAWDRLFGAPRPAGNRRRHARIAQAEPRRIEIGLRRLDVGLGGALRGNRSIILLLADRLFGQQRLIAADHLPCVGGGRLRAGKLGARRIDVRGQLARIDAEQRLARGDIATFLEQAALDDPVDARAHFGSAIGLHAAGQLDDIGHRLRPDRHDVDLGRRRRRRRFRRSASQQQGQRSAGA